MEGINPEILNTQIRRQEATDSVYTSRVSNKNAIRSILGDYERRSYEELSMLEKNYESILRLLKTSTSDFEEIKYHYAAILRTEAESAGDMTYDIAEHLLTILDKAQLQSEIEDEIAAIRREQILLQAKAN